MDSCSMRLASGIDARCSRLWWRCVAKTEFTSKTDRSGPDTPECRSGACTFGGNWPIICGDHVIGTSCLFGIGGVFRSMHGTFGSISLPSYTERGWKGLGNGSCILWMANMCELTPWLAPTMVKVERNVCSEHMLEFVHFLDLVPLTPTAPGDKY